jgi:predicted XRE-type DNA-binding protein
MATKTKVQVVRSRGNVFEDLGFGHEEAEHLRIRSALMAAIVKLIKVRKLTQSNAAVLFGVSQPRISDLVRGRIDLFSIDTLVEMLAKADVRVEVRVPQVA